MTVSAAGGAPSPSIASPAGAAQPVIAPPASIAPTAGAIPAQVAVAPPAGRDDQRTALTVPPSTRRSSRSHAAILAATIAVLAEHGFAGLTIEGIAARAGVGKATIYRHWRSRAELVIEAFGSLERPEFPPATGDLRADLVARVRAVITIATEPPLGSILPSLLDAAERDPELAALLRLFVAQRRHLLLDVLDVGMTTGTVAPTTDVEVVADLLAGPVFYRRLVSRADLGPTYADRLVDTLLRAVAPPG